MPPIFVISLVTAEQRRQHVSRQLLNEGLDFEFFDAIEAESDPDHLHTECDYDLFELNTGRFPVGGEIGCFFSHRSLWVHCVNIDKPIVILEDDFKLSSSLSSALLSAHHQIEELGFIRLQSEWQAKKQKIGEIDDYSLWRFTKAPHCTMGYIISPDAAKKLIDASHVIESPVDVFIKMYWQHGQPLHAITPYPLSDSDLSYSSFIGVREKKQRTIRRRLARNVYRTKHWFRRVKASTSFRLAAAKRENRPGLESVSSSLVYRDLSSATKASSEQ